MRDLTSANITFQDDLCHWLLHHQTWCPSRTRHHPQQRPLAWSLDPLWPICHRFEARLKSEHSTITLEKMVERYLVAHACRLRNVDDLNKLCRHDRKEVLSAWIITCAIDRNAKNIFPTGSRSDRYRSCAKQCIPRRSRQETASNWLVQIMLDASLVTQHVSCSASRVNELTYSININQFAFYYPSLPFQRRSRPRIHCSVLG